MPLMPILIRCFVACMIAGLTWSAGAQTVPPKATPDATLGSTPETVIWGYLTADLPPALTIKSGQTVKIDTVSHQGLLGKEDPATFFASAGIPKDQVLQDAIDMRLERARADRPDLRGRRSSRRHAGGPHPQARTARALWGEQFGPDLRRIARLPLRAGAQRSSSSTWRATSHCSRMRIEVPLSPFLGIMSVAPSRDVLLVSSRPPWRWGGNIDFNKLTAGATLYLPVFNNGAQFYTGDPHAVQGDGEVNGTAIEASLAATLQFVLHKGAGKAMRWPRAEDATHYYMMGMDLDLNVAMRHATRETVDFLQEQFGLSAADAYALASIAVDFRVAEAVDSVQMIYGMIPKKLFKKNAEYWAR